MRERGGGQDDLTTVPSPNGKLKTKDFVDTMIPIFM